MDNHDKVMELSRRYDRLDEAATAELAALQTMASPRVNENKQIDLNVAARLRAANKLSGKNKSNICEALGISKSAFTHYLSAESAIPQHLYESLSVVLEVDINWLLKGERPGIALPIVMDLSGISYEPETKTFQFECEGRLDVPAELLERFR